MGEDGKNVGAGSKRGSVEATNSITEPIRVMGVPAQRK